MTSKIQKFIIGFMIFVVLTSSLYILLPNKVRIDIEDTRTIFKIYENNYWIISGIEYVNIFDGTSKMRANSRNITYLIEDNKTIITRLANYKDNISTIEIYIFNGSTKDLEKYPVSHSIQVINGKDKILQYEVQKLFYTQETISDINPPQSFGHNMKVEWEEGNYYSKIYKYSGKDEGKLTIKYKIDSDYFNKNVRLFDPAPQWDDGWSSFKLINITENSGKNLNNYSIIINNFNCFNNCKSNGEDIRVVYANTTELPFALQKTNSSFYNITFGVDLNANSFNDSIYVYYNNKFASAKNSSWNNIRYIAYDDFSTDISNSNWKCVDDICSYNATSQRMNLKSGLGFSSAMIIYNGSYFNDVLVEFDLIQFYAHYINFTWIATEAINNSFDATEAGLLSRNFIQSNGTIYIYNGTGDFEHTNVYSNPITNQLIHINNTFYNISSSTNNIALGTNKTIISINSTKITDNFYIRIHQRSGTTEIDNFSVRSYTYPEPTYISTTETTMEDINITITTNTSLEFYPSNLTHKGVIPINQSNNIGVFTAHNNLTTDGKLVFRLNETDSDIIMKIGNSSNYTNATILLNTTYQTIYANLSSGNTIYIWAWADYNLTYWKEWFPDLEIKLLKL